MRAAGILALPVAGRDRITKGFYAPTGGWPVSIPIKIVSP